MVRALGSIFAMVLLAACSSPRTQVMLVVDTDLRPPRGLDSFTVSITGPDGETRTSNATLGADQPPLPRTLALVHEQGPLGPFTVRVAGNTGPSERVARTARFTFQPERTLTLRIDLLASCIGAACAADQTCASGGCRAIDVAPAELTEWTGTPPALDPDASMPPADAGPDAGRDAGFDAGLDGGTDAGFDAGMDAGTDLGTDLGTDAGPPDLGVDLCVPMSEVCNGRDDDCDGVADNGIDIATDINNCGMCGRVCNFQNTTTGACVTGECVVTGACNPGFDDCNADGFDGCEVDLSADRLHCGRCGDRCGGGRVCCDGNCDRSCAP